MLSGEDQGTADEDQADRPEQLPVDSEQLTCEGESPQADEKDSQDRAALARRRGDPHRRIACRNLALDVLGTMIAAMR